MTSDQVPASQTPAGETPAGQMPARQVPPDRSARRRRRAPAPEERKVDAERSKAALIDAALEEFSAKGFAATRVRDIAERAGVSKDLIAYHFGGKEGLYRAMQQVWMMRRDAFVDYDRSPADNMVSYLHDVLRDPRPLRLLAWRSLALESGASPDVSDEVYPSVADVTRRQARGEVDPDVDPAALQLALLGAVAAPVVFPDSVGRLFGLDPTDPRFEDRYRVGLLRLLRAVGASFSDPDCSDPGASSDSAGGEAHPQADASGTRPQADAGGEAHPQADASGTRPQADAGGEACPQADIGGRQRP
jgi:TetR/AcrR family transcriptional regulator